MVPLIRLLNAEVLMCIYVETKNNEEYKEFLARFLSFCKVCTSKQKWSTCRGC
jgi:hypothetical protein